MAESDDQFLRNIDQGINKKEAGPDYEPDIEYTPDKVSPYQYYQEQVSDISDQNIADPVDKSSIRHTHSKIDFLLKKAEGKLSKYDNFDDFKEAVIKKYYCQLALANNEKSIVNNFKNKLSNLDTDTKQTNENINDDGIAVDAYVRLMSLKKDITLDEDDMDRVYSQASDSIAAYSNKLNRYEQEMDNINSHLSAEEKRQMAENNNYDDLIKSVNEQINRIDKGIRDYRNKKEEAEKNNNRDKAIYYRDKIEMAEADINQVQNSLSLFGQQSYALNKKAEEADSYLNKIAYRLAASPYDRLDESICCFIRLILRRLDIDKKYILDANIDFLDEGLNDLPINELKNAIDAIRGILFLAYTNKEQLLDNLEDFLMSLIMSPIRGFVSSVLSSLRSLESEAFIQAQDFLDGFVHMDIEDPSNVLDCFSLEAFGDFVYDELEKTFDKLESAIMDLLKLIHEEADFFDEDAIELTHKDKIRQYYKLLTSFSELLGTIDNFTLSDTVDNWIEGFLQDIDMGETYNPATGQFEPIDISGCIVQTPKDNAYTEFLPDDVDNAPGFNIPDMKEYRDFLRDSIGDVNLPDSYSNIPDSGQDDSNEPDSYSNIPDSGQDNSDEEIDVVLDSETDTIKNNVDDIDNIPALIEQRLGDNNNMPVQNTSQDPYVPNKDTDEYTDKEINNINIKSMIKHYTPIQYDCKEYSLEQETTIQEQLGDVNLPSSNI